MDIGTNNQQDFIGVENLSDEVKDFLRCHGPQLIANNFPMNGTLINQLFNKLKEQNYDAGSSFQIMADPGANCYRLMSLKDIPKESEVFLVDHCYSFRYDQLRKEVERNPALRKRISKMLKFWSKKKTVKSMKITPHSVNDPKQHLEFDNQPITDPRTLDLDWENVITLSFYGCQISNPDFIAEILPKMPKLKALWVNNNPCCLDAEHNKLLTVFVENRHQGVEIFNSKFTKNTDEWGIKYSTFKGNMKLVEGTKFEDMKMIDISNREYGNMSKKLHDVLIRLQQCTKIILNGTTFGKLADCNRLLESLRDMKKLTDLEMDYYLLDLFWKIKDKIRELNSGWKYINGYDLGFSQPKEGDDDTDLILQNIWKVIGTYRITQGTNQVDKLPVLYCQDEVGNAMTHQVDANFTSVPFMWFPHNDAKKGSKPFNIFWPVKDVKAEEFATCNKLLGVAPEIHASKLALWEKVELKPFIDAFTYREKSLDLKTKIKFEVRESADKLASSSNGERLKVYTDSEQVKCNLGNEKFEIVQDVGEAKVIWFTKSQIKDDSGELLLNSFEGEDCFVNKLKFSENIIAVRGKPDWFPETYDLSKDINTFIGHYITNQTNNIPNFWITKPTNLYNSLDMSVTNNLDQIIKLSETGPKLASKYVENPIRYRGSKFDLRFFVLVRSFNPLEVYVHKHFLVDIAKNDFTLDKRRLFQYDTHHTLNYNHKVPGVHVEPAEFIKFYNLKNAVKFDQITTKIHTAIIEALELSSLKTPELSNNSQGRRGLYGVDFIIDADYNVKLLEFNNNPATDRAIKSQPKFWTDVFSCLFLGEEKNVTRIK